MTLVAKYSSVFTQGREWASCAVRHHLQNEYDLTPTRILTDYDLVFDCERVRIDIGQVSVQMKLEPSDLDKSFVSIFREKFKEPLYNLAFAAVIDPCLKLHVPVPDHG